MSEVINLFKKMIAPKKTIQEFKNEKAKYDSKEEEKSIPQQEIYTVKITNGLGKEYLINYIGDFNEASELYNLLSSEKIKSVELEKTIEKTYCETTRISISERRNHEKKD